MQSAKKVTLVMPELSQEGGSAENGVSNIDVNTNERFNKIKNKIYEKIHRFIIVILKLAKMNCYDDFLRIKSENGDFLDKSNIVDLLTNSMTVGKILYGEDQFIVLLSKAKVDPKLILNENVRNKLIEYNKINREAYNSGESSLRGEDMIIDVNDDSHQDELSTNKSTKTSPKIYYNKSNQTDSNFSDNSVQTISIENNDQANQTISLENKDEASQTLSTETDEKSIQASSNHMDNNSVQTLTNESFNKTTQTPHQILIVNDKGVGQRTRSKRKLIQNSDKTNNKKLKLDNNLDIVTDDMIDKTSWKI